MRPVLVVGVFWVVPLVVSAQVSPDSTRDSVYALPGLTVTVTRGNALLDQIPMAVSVIDRGGRGRSRLDLTLEDALAGVPGVYLANRYNYSLDQRLSIRGFGSRANFGLRGVKVLLDGVPQTLPDGQSQLTNVEFGAIDRIEVLRGSASSLYGNASGGVIALNTEPPSNRPFAQRIRVESGAFGLFKAESHTSARSGKVAGTLTASWFDLEGFRAHSEAEAFQLQGTGQALLSPRLVLEVRGAHSHAPTADNPGALTAAELAADPSQAAPNNLARHAGKDVDQQQASITLRRYGSAENRFAVTLFGLSRSLDNPLATNVFVTLDRLAGGIRFEATNRLTASTRLTWGLDLQRMRDDRTNRVLNQGRPTDTLLLDQRETVTELGPFVHLLWQPGSRFMISAGARYDRVSFDVNDHFLGDSVDNSGSRSMSALSGHVGMSLIGSPTVTPYVNASTSFETPTTTELVNQPNGAGGFNDQLDPQRAITLEAGVRGNPRPWLSYSAAAFLGRISDALIQFSEVGGRAFFTNAGRLHNDGMEFWLRVSPTPALGLAASYTFAHYRFARYRIVNGTAVDTLDGNRLAGVPNHFLRLWLQVNPIPAIHFDLEQQLSSSVFADDANRLEAEGWGAGVTSIRGSAELVVGAIVLEPFGGINNLFDRSYVSSVTVNGFGGRVFEPAPGRNGYFGVEVRYR